MMKWFKALQLLTRGERIGFTFSAILFLLAIVFRVIHAEVNEKQQLIQAIIPVILYQDEEETSIALNSGNLKTEIKPSKAEHGLELLPIPFDPNKVSRRLLDSIGLPAFIAGNMVKYRSAGGTFRKKEDLRRIYGMDSSIFSKLEPLILLSDGYSEESAETIATLRRDLANSQKEDVQESANPVYRETDSIDHKHKVELNSADTLDLLLLPGIGPVFARRILKYRSLLGGYYRLEQLLEVYGMDSTRYHTFIQQVTIDTSQIEKLNLKSVAYTELLRHPYINREQTRAILAWRGFSADSFTVGSILDQGIMEVESFSKARPYLSVGEGVK